MKNTKLQLVTKIAWAALLVATLIAKSFNGDAGLIGLVIVALGWTCVKIVSEGITASLILMRADEDE